jgi:phage-related tail protein
MATQVALAIKIQSEGGEKVLKNLQDLETELGRLQTDLKTLDFGTQEFDVAVKNINRLKSSIKDVDKATEGLEAAQRVQAIGEAISIVVGGFQLLSGIIGIFISDSEDLEAVQRAEAKAVSILNAAVGIQTIVFQAAELKAKGYTLASVAATIATKAQTAATRVATAVQVAFNAALAANPIGLVIAGIVALGAAIFGVVKIYENYFSASAKLENQLETENKAEQDLIKTKIESSRQLEDQLKILTDNLQTRALENKTIENLMLASTLLLMKIISLQKKE